MVMALRVVMGGEGPPRPTGTAAGCSWSSSSRSTSGLAHPVPAGRHAKVVEASVTWNYTTFLNIAFLALAAALLARLFTTGGAGMLKMMGGDPERLSAAGRPGWRIVETAVVVVTAMVLLARYRHEHRTAGDSPAVVVRLRQQHRRRHQT